MTITKHAKHASPTTFGEYTTVEQGVAYAQPDHDTLDITETFGVYIHIRRDEQATHTHLFSDIQPDGGGACVECGANAWAAEWVRVGYMGADTHTWIAMQERANKDMVEQSAFEAVASILNQHSVVIADLNPDTPARVGGRHRKGA